MLRVTIRDASPATWRRVAVPSSFTLEPPHTTLQFVVGWLHHHLYAFAIGERRVDSPHDELGEGDPAATTGQHSLDPRPSDS